MKSLILDVMFLGRLLINIKKRMGFNMVFWGILEIIGDYEEVELLIIICWLCLVKKF